jgi:hypothetical protein
LTGQGFFWVSRLKEKTTYQIKEVLAYDEQKGILDAIVWLGKYRADQAAYAVRLVIFCYQGKQYRSSSQCPGCAALVDVGDRLSF